MDGTPFGRYRLVELLGRGGMGEVWRAYDTETDRVVALKLLPGNFSDDEDFQRRFRREAHAAARLNSPHVIPIHHYGEIDGRLYVDMRLIEGRDLQTVLADGPLEPARAVHIVGQVAKALHAAHEVGLLHRDIKPSNILLDRDDFAYLIDFGIARVLGETRMTKSGYMIGTFQYIAPERLGTGAEDARADIYSLACVLYECLTGHPPFDGDTMAPLIAAHLNTPPPRPSINQPNVAPQVDDVIATGMAKDPNQRYATTIELADAARDAITAPIRRPAPPSAQPATHLAKSPPLLPSTEQADNRAAAPPTTAKAESLASTQPTPPSQPAPTGWRRRTRAIIAVAIVVILAAGGIIGYLYIHARLHPELPFAGLDRPRGVAVDSAGNVYVADSGYARVVKLMAGSTTQSVLPFTGLSPLAVETVETLHGVAVDTGGNVYVADNANNRVLELAAGSNSQTVLPFTGLHGVWGVAVDTAGNVYVADVDNNRVLELAPGSSDQTVLPFTDLTSPAGVAVDIAGNVYVVDTNHKRVLKLAAGSSIQSVLPFAGLNSPLGVAADTAGGVYITDSNHFGDFRVLKLAVGAGTQTLLPYHGSLPSGVAVDAAGNVYVADSGNGMVVKLSPWYQKWM